MYVSVFDVHCSNDKFDNVELLSEITLIFKIWKVVFLTHSTTIHPIRRLWAVIVVGSLNLKVLIAVIVKR
jgi:hypothetical protein